MFFGLLSSTYFKISQRFEKWLKSTNIDIVKREKGYFWSADAYDLNLCIHSTSLKHGYHGNVGFQPVFKVLVLKFLLKFNSAPLMSA